MLCISCQFDNPEGFRFCGRCGSPLAAGQTAGEIATGDRRQLTVMFCDLAGSTALSERLDPEDLREVVRVYQRVCAEIIESFEGHVAQYLGDGIMVYFGWPEAHEDDARRAVLAGLGIVDAVPEMEAEPLRRSGLRPAVRVGIDTGEVVTGEVGGGRHRELLAMGQTPNVAARLQTMAELDTVAMSANTHRLTKGMFDLRELGTFELKGVSEPLAVYQPIQESLAAERQQALRSPLVGRDREVGWLLERFSRAREGQGCAVLVDSDAGVGKTRLLGAVREGLSEEPHRWLVGACSPYARNTSLRAFVQLLERLFELSPDAEGGERRLRSVEQGLDALGLPAMEAVPLLGSLLKLPWQDRYDSLGYAPELRKRKLFEVLIALLQRVAAEKPLVVVIEDLHWSDPSTLEFLKALISSLADGPMLVLLSFRSGFEPPWDMDGVERLRLGRLDREHVAHMVSGLTDGRRLPEPVLELLLEKTDGVPLFVEELFKMLLESGAFERLEDRYELARPLPDLAIPETLRDSLMARLDRQVGAKRVAQMAAVLGREFSLKVLRAALRQEAGRLEAQLVRLVEAGLLQIEETEPKVRYSFKHALIQDAAIGSLLTGQLRGFHRRAGEVLESLYPDLAESKPELLGHHWSEARAHDRAARYLRRAGDRAKSNFANDEALAFYSQARDHLKSLVRERDDQSSEWTDDAIEVAESHADVLALTGRRDLARRTYRGARAQMPEDDPIRQARLYRKVAFEWVMDQQPEQALRAFMIAEAELGPQPAEPSLEWRREWLQIQLDKLWHYYNRAEIEELEKLVGRMRPVVRYGTALQRAKFLGNLVAVALRRERYEISDQTLEDARALDAASLETEDAQQISNARFTLAFTLLCRGLLEEASDQLSSALELAQRTGEQSYVLGSLSYLGLAFRRRDQADEAESWIGRGEELAATAGVPHYLGVAKANRAWLAWRDGDSGRATELAREALDLWADSPLVYPFQWTGRLPLLAVELAEGRLEAAVEQAAAILDPDQQKLVDALEEQLAAARDRWPDSAAAAKASLDRALDLAREHALL